MANAKQRKKLQLLQKRFEQTGLKVVIPEKKGRNNQKKKLNQNIQKAKIAPVNKLKELNRQKQVSARIQQHLRTQSNNVRKMLGQTIYGVTELAITPKDLREAEVQIAQRDVVRNSTRNERVVMAYETIIRYLKSVNDYEQYTSSGESIFLKDALPVQHFRDMAIAKLRVMYRSESWSEEDMLQMVEAINERIITRVRSAMGSTDSRNTRPLQPIRLSEVITGGIK